LRIRSVLFALIAVLLGSGARADIEKLPLFPSHSLRLFHTHTHERIDIVFRRGQEYIPEALNQLDHFLRDSRTGEVHHYDPRVFDLLSDLTAAAGHPEGELQVICGYRAPATNEYLRTHTSGVAKNSRHVLAEAIDIRLPGVKLAEFRQTALSLARGGVGFYPASDFIHVDVGPVRRW
jgi:uncharacterized protein YcbK (DUF882 family)